MARVRLGRRVVRLVQHAEKSTHRHQRQARVAEPIGAVEAGHVLSRAPRDAVGARAHNAVRSLRVLGRGRAKVDAAVVRTREHRRLARVVGRQVGVAPKTAYAQSLDTLL